MLKQMQLIVVLVIISILSGCTDDKPGDAAMINHQADKNNSPISTQMRALEQAKGVEQLTQDSFEQRQQEIDRQSE